MRKAVFLLLWGLIGWHLPATGQTILGKGLSVLDTTQRHVIMLHDGSQMLGRVITIHNGIIRFQAEGAADTSLYLFQRVRYVGLSSEPILYAYEPKSPSTNSDAGEQVNENYTYRKPEVPAPLNHLLFDGTALPPLSKGIYRNTMLLFNQVDVHLGKHFSMGGSIFVPGILVARIQGRASLNELLHVGATLQSGALLFGNGGVTIPYAMLTLGKHRQYINLTYGWWIENYRYQEGTDTYRKIGLAASHSISENWRFYVECAVITGPFTNELLPTFNVSHHRYNRSWDIGLFNIPSSSVLLIPFVSYSRVF